MSESAIYGADLRNNSIPCGDCSFEEEDMDGSHDEIKRDIRRLDTELDGHERETDRGITELRANYTHIATSLDAQTKILAQIDRRLALVEGDIKKYNQLKERLDILEKTESHRSDNYIPRQEYNQAMISVRQYAESKAAYAEGKAEGVNGKLIMLQWALVVIVGAFGGAFGFVAARVFG